MKKFYLKNENSNIFDLLFSILKKLNKIEAQLSTK